MALKFLGGVALLASIVAGVGAASAAGLAVKAPVYKAPPVIVSDWSGFYIGLNRPPLILQRTAAAGSRLSRSHRYV